MTKDSLVESIRAFAAEVDRDRAMMYGDVDHVARLLAEQRNVVAVAKKKRKANGPASMRPIGGKPSDVPPPAGKIYRNMSTPESREFWESCEEVEREVDTWPAWKRAW